MARDRSKYEFTFVTCPGSNQPPYRYVPGYTEGYTNEETGRYVYPRAKCEVCGKEISVNVTGVLRKHLQRVPI